MINSLKKNSVFDVITFLLLLTGSFILCYYFQLKHYIIAGLFLFSILSFAQIKFYNRKDLDSIKKIPVIFMATIFSLAMILGFHIHTKSTLGQIDENYITPYLLIDIVVFVLMICLFYKIIIYVIRVFSGWARHIQIKNEKVSLKFRLLLTTILFLLWLPYLVVWSPGFIFGDSINSIWQAIGTQHLNNHHPIVYTLFIKLCIETAKILGGDITLGCLIYSVIQMLFMSYGISYMIAWLKARFSINKFVVIILVLIYGLSAYMAQFSIAMWKDPIFSTSVLLLTLKIMDAINKNMFETKDAFTIALLSLIMVFIRNNGFYVTVAMIVFGICGILYYKKFNKQRVYISITIILLLVACVSKIITGPLYKRIGIEDDSLVESYGIFLNQMARVVVYNGNLSENDLKYMNEILPIENYQFTYSPCCIDNLKWNKHFNGKPLEHDFFKHYLSIVSKNPKIAFESWQLQTYGFWAINRKEINKDDSNLAKGVIRNIYKDNSFNDNVDIKFVRSPESIGSIISWRGWFIPIPWINWFLFFMCVICFSYKRWDLLLVLSPSLGIFASLIIASPIYYWSRYAAAEQFLLPVYIYIFILMLHQNKRKDKRH